MPSSRSVLVPVVLVAVLASAAVAKVSHAGWPRIDGRFVMHKHSETRPIVGTRRNDKLLGGNGSDTIHGGAGSDVLWGSWDPVQPTNVYDRMWGGPGRDFIYASHGRNRIDAGAGDDVVHAHFGHGVVDCGPGDDLIYLSHHGRRGWKVSHCEHVTYHAGESTLTPRG